MQHYLDSQSYSNPPEIDESELERSFSMPIPRDEMEDKLIEPLVLERQPFSNLINFSRHHQYNFANPLDKVDLKNPFKNNNFENSYHHHLKFNERNFEEV